MAETCFEEWAKLHKIKVEPWGVDRSEFDDFQYLPATVRWRPDRVCEDLRGVLKKDYKLVVRRKHFFMECKGVGRDQVVKIKPKHLVVLKDIEMFDRLPIVFFIYDSHNKKHTFATRDDIETIAQDVPLKTFHEGNEYYAIPTDAFTWTLNWWRNNDDNNRG